MKIEGSVQEIKEFMNTFVPKERNLSKEQLEQSYQYVNKKLGNEL